MLNDQIRMAFLTACDGDHDEALSVLAAYAALLREALEDALATCVHADPRWLPERTPDLLYQINTREAAAHLGLSPLSHD